MPALTGALSTKWALLPTAHSAVHRQKLRGGGGGIQKLFRSSEEVTDLMLPGYSSEAIHAYQRALDLKPNNILELLTQRESSDYQNGYKKPLFICFLDAALKPSMPTSAPWTSNPTTCGHGPIWASALQMSASMKSELL
eukprot:1160795-Pelagomonas_calceolata.AAC.5